MDFYEDQWFINVRRGLRQDPRASQYWRRSSDNYMQGRDRLAWVSTRSRLARTRSCTLRHRKTTRATRWIECLMSWLPKHVHHNSVVAGRSRCCLKSWLPKQAQPRHRRHRRAVIASTRQSAFETSLLKMSSLTRGIAIERDGSVNGRPRKGFIVGKSGRDRGRNGLRTFPLDTP